MAPPTIESLTGMGLLGKKDHIITEVLSLRDDAKKRLTLTNSAQPMEV